LREASGTRARGPSVVELLSRLADIPGNILDAAKALDKHSIPTRYPSCHPAGAPGDLYTAPEADRALTDAEMVVDHLRHRFP